MGYIEKSLSGDEQVVSKFSYHWIVYIFPLMLCMVVIGIIPLLKILFTEQGVTTKRGIKKEGIISRNTEELHLSKVETVEIKQGVLGRILGYGDVELTGTGLSGLVFKTVSSPMNVKKKIDTILNK